MELQAPDLPGTATAEQGRETAPPPDALQVREAALKPHRRRLGLDGAAVPVTPLTDGLDIDGQKIPLEPWEQVAVEAERRGAGLSGPGDPLIVEGLAFRVKAACRADRLACLCSNPGGPERFGSLLEELTLDTTVGLAISHDFQESINRLVVAGEMSDAKKLTGCRNKLGTIITGLKTCIGEEAYTRAEREAKSMIAPLREVSTSSGPELGKVIEASWRKKRAATVRVAERAESAQPKTKPLALLLLCCVALWTVLILPRFVRPELPVLEAEDFGTIQAVTEITARPPSLFAKVHLGRWTKLAPEGRLAVLEQLGKVAGEAGYSGVHVTTNDGTAVGKWLSKTGVRVLVPAEPATD
jgi:hypothetical protein